MKRSLRPPRFLPDVLEAIYELKETGGSNSNKIVKHVQTSLNNLMSTPRNVSTQIRKALKHAATTGILKERAGKFKINSKMLDPYKDCAECRRRKRLAKKRKKRHRRHSIAPRVRSHSESDSETCHLYRSDSDADDYPTRQHRKRRRKGSKKRRGRGRRRSSRHDRAMTPAILEELRKDTFYPDDYKPEEIQIQDGFKCDNPECLCNVKEEEDVMQNDDSPM